jgi:hypothetical protein
MNQQTANKEVVVASQPPRQLLLLRIYSKRHLFAHGNDARVEQGDQDVLPPILQRALQEFAVE